MEVGERREKQEEGVGGGVRKRGRSGERVQGEGKGGEARDHCNSSTLTVHLYYTCVHLFSRPEFPTCLLNLHSLLQYSPSLDQPSPSCL